MPPSRDAVGERIASLEAKLGEFMTYERDRWHKQDNDLTPIINLPERMTREIGKLHGLVEGRMASNAKEMERSFTAAIEKAMAPFADDMREVKAKLDKHEEQLARFSGARIFAAWLLGTIAAILGSIGFKGSH